MKLFRRKITQEDVDKLNTLNALSERPIIKVCKLCKHYMPNHGTPACGRDLYKGFNSVTGADDTLGEKHYCESEREIKHSYSYSSDSKCGAIGQFWEPAVPKKAFWKIW